MQNPRRLNDKNAHRFLSIKCLKGIIKEGGDFKGIIMFPYCIGLNMGEEKNGRRELDMHRYCQPYN